LLIPPCPPATRSRGGLRDRAEVIHLLLGGLMKTIFPAHHRVSWRGLSMLCLGLLLPLAAQAQYRILFVGNSFTFAASAITNQATRNAGGVPEVFNRLATASGHTNISVVMEAVGGMDYRFHDTNATAQATISSQAWDYLILQNFSTDPTHYVDGLHSISNHMYFGEDLYRRAMTNNPQTKVILFETWSRAAASSYISGVSGPTNFASTAQFQTELHTNYLNLARLLNAKYATNRFVRVAPVGDAWQNAGGLRAATDPQYVNLFATDFWHGNDNGYYVTAAVFYSMIYGHSAHGLSSNSLISELQLNLTVSPTFLEDVAWSTVSNSLVTAMQPLLVATNQVTVQWSGEGQLQWASSPLGPWNSITPAPPPPYTEPLATNGSRYYRLLTRP